MHNFPATANNPNPAGEQLDYLLAHAQHFLARQHCNRELALLGLCPDPKLDPVAFEVWAVLALALAETHKLADYKEKLDQATEALLAWGRRELASRGQLGTGALLLLDSDHPKIRECVLAKLAGWNTTSPERWPQINN